MADKTKRIFPLISVLFTSLFVFPLLANQPINSDSVKAMQIAVSYDSNRIPGMINTSDGSQWNALFETDKSVPKMIFGCDCQTNFNEPELIARNFLSLNADVFNFKNIDVNLKKAKKLTSPGSTHIIYQQKLQE